MFDKKNSKIVKSMNYIFLEFLRNFHEKTIYFIQHNILMIKSGDFSLRMWDRNCFRLRYYLALNSVNLRNDWKLIVSLQDFRNRTSIEKTPLSLIPIQRKVEMGQVIVTSPLRGRTKNEIYQCYPSWFFIEAFQVKY